MTKENTTVKMAVMAEQISNIQCEVKEINSKLDKNYITQDKMTAYAERLDRLEKIVYGVVAVVGTAILLAIIKLVIIQ